MPNLNQKYKQKFKLNSQVVTTELDPTEAVLLHLENHNYYTLNETGWYIWNLIGEELTIEEIVTKIQDEFEVDGKKAEQFVVALIEHLSEEKLVEMVQN